MYKLLGVLSVVIFPLYLAFSGRSWFVRHHLPYIMIVVGTVLVVVCLIVFGRYKKILDYEPVMFLGQETKGKYVRDGLLRLGVVGGWAAIMGTVLMLFRK